MAIAWPSNGRAEATAIASSTRPRIGWRARCSPRGGAAAEPVALLFDHGGEALAAILAVLKAGKFYVVVDPGYPADRLQYMLEDSGARLLVTDDRNRDYARRLCGSAIELVGFDDVDPQQPGSAVDVLPAPDALAMILYTSGPTECLTVCVALVPHGTPIANGKLPIGHCLPDKDVVLLDESRREVAAGDVGEIAVRSRFTSLGYWRAPAPTAAAFLPDPAGGDARIYLTGDLGHRLPDGTLVHVGRRDFLVKIRGFRVDVAEIENARRTIAGVGDAVVVGREMAPGEQRLIACVVPTTKPAVSRRRLREEIARVLPDYMIPSAFVALDAIPRTPNGKTDRVHLPLPERNRRDPETPLVAPVSAIEIELAAIWAAVLGLDRVGIEDRFLDLGGDSLQAARIAGRVTTRYRLGIGAATLLESATVARMAQVVAAALGGGDDGGAVPLTRRIDPGDARRGDAKAGGGSD